MNQRKSKNKVTVILIFVFLCHGCKSTNEDYLQRVQGLGINPYEIENIILIPNEGCGGCINGATVYAMTNEGELIKKRAKVIFTGVKDYKVFKNRIGLEFMTSDLVLLDSMNRFMQEPVLSIYPQLIRLNSGKAVEVLEFDPNFDILDLEKKVK